MIPGKVGKCDMQQNPTSNIHFSVLRKFQCPRCEGEKRYSCEKDDEDVQRGKQLSLQRYSGIIRRMDCLLSMLQQGGTPSLTWYDVD
jgi:hypothetical protein